MRYQHLCKGSFYCFAFPLCLSAIFERAIQTSEWTELRGRGQRATLVGFTDAALLPQEDTVCALDIMTSHRSDTAADVWGNEKFSYSFTSACNPSHSFLPHIPSSCCLTLTQSPHHTQTHTHAHTFKSRSRFCSQKCWVPLFALHTEIRWGCKLSPNICSLEWSRRSARTGLVCMLFSEALSEWVMNGFVCASVCMRMWLNNYSNRCFVSFWAPY